MDNNLISTENQGEIEKEATCRNFRQVRKEGYGNKPLEQAMASKQFKSVYLDKLLSLQYK